VGFDRKYGRVTTERGTIGEDEPVIVFRAQDNQVVPMLEHYIALCAAAGSPQRHHNLLQGTREAVRVWQQDPANYTQVPQSKDWPEP
jgi:hypothetical protein